MEERNSEGSFTKWFALAGVIIASVLGILQGVLDNGFLGQEETAYAVISTIVSIGGVLLAYIWKRPDKHKAIAYKEQIAKLTQAQIPKKQGNTPNPS